MSLYSLMLQSVWQAAVIPSGVYESGTGMELLNSPKNTRVLH